MGVQNGSRLWWISFAKEEGPLGVSIVYASRSDAIEKGYALAPFEEDDSIDTLVLPTSENDVRVEGYEPNKFYGEGSMNSPMLEIDELDRAVLKKIGADRFGMDR